MTKAPATPATLNTTRPEPDFVVDDEAVVAAAVVPVAVAEAVAEAAELEEVDEVPLIPIHDANCCSNAKGEPLSGFSLRQVMHCPQR
jgi:hypothetical protein